MRILCLAAALAASGCAAAIDRMDVDAARTAARVTTALVNDKDVGARVIHVRVDRDGVAYLSGRVASDTEAARAVTVAGGVSGVSRVVSSLEVGAAAPPPTARDRPHLPPNPKSAAAAEFAELEVTYDLLAIGASVGWSDPGEMLFDSHLAFGPVVRIGSGRGFGAAVGFDWFQTTVTADRAPGAAVSTVHVRPLMAGVSYTFRRGPLSISPSIVGGYSFNSLSVPADGTAGRLAVDVGNSLVWRPAISAWIDTGRRTAVNVSVGRVMTRLPLTFVGAGMLDERRVKGDATVVHVGFAYRLF